ncbi:TNT domain-containing protein [Lentzea sp. NEAU-D13]|uniref:TNT domain-containing protein n=1 Tax=Lentzea alba TaxID=2714351 RepID=A0A7C9RN31_9PSEU|nr:TNT domain-containing protein [Lentzea alba]NGY58548.1 TNT domain-containing protein [Lentzea alba]
MSEPKPLNPTEQDALVKQIGLTLMRAAPEDWRSVIAQYRATGRYFELEAELRLQDGTSHSWAVPQDVASLFARLRAGMHREGRGSWTNARYQLDHPSSYNLDFDRAEPSWQTPPPQQAYFDEMRFFPRVDENVPDWLRRRLNPPTPVFRTVRVFDGAGPGGRPSVNRPPVPEPEVAPLLAYLSNAPVAVAGRGFDADVLDRESPQVVPSGFQTDGAWIWPVGVSYYLRKYGVPPEPELVERARAAGFSLPEVSEESRLAAAANLGAPAAPPGTVVPAPPQVEPAPEPEPQPQSDETQYVTPPKFDDEPEPEVEEYDFEPLTPEPQAAEVTTEQPQIQPLIQPQVQHVEPEPEREPEDVPATVAVPVPGVDGPPYRVVFDSDGVPDVDDRRLRDTYGAGMDLFAPHPTEVEEPEPVAVVVPAPVPDVVAEEPTETDLDHEQDVVDVDDEPEIPTAGPDEPELLTHHREEERTDHLVAETAERPRDAMQDTMAWSPVLDEPQESPAEVTEEHPVVPVAEDEPDLTEDEVESTASFEREAFEPAGFEPAGFEPTGFEAAGFEPQKPHFENKFESQFDAPRVVEPVAEPSPAMVAPLPVAAPAPTHVEETTQFDAALFNEPEVEPEVEPEPEPEPEPVKPPRQVTQEEDRELAGTRRALDDLSVPHGVYRIGEPADRTWTLRLDGDSWEVCWFDHGPKNPVRFDKVEDASAYLVGRLVMGNFRTIVRTPPPPPPPQRPMSNGFREEPRRPVPPQRPPMPPPAQPAPQAPAPQAAPVQQAPAPQAPPPPAPTQQVPAPAPAPIAAAVAQEEPSKRKFPISPLAGEPPLTLFRHKQMFELPAGTEVDRYGDQAGNLVYVAGTPFPERSLVPSWINRPYRVYRLRRPLEVLSGVAVPWFEQPGGGTAYLLPKAIEEMVADGVLVEITGSADH